MYGVIYLIINHHNLENNLRPFLYIGSTTKNGKDYEEYFSSSKFLKDDVNTLGISFFTKTKLFERYDFKSIEELLDKEAEYQKLFDAVKSDIFYNRAYANGQFYNISGEHTANTIWINNGIQNKRIVESDLQQYPEWSKGRLAGDYMKDRIYINNGVITKSISKDELHLYSEWTIGRLSGNQSNKVWINNSIIRKLVSKEDLDFYLTNNWTVGYVLSKT